MGTAYAEQQQNQLIQQRHLFDVVNAITVSLTSTLSLEEIYDRIANPVRETLNVASVSIGLIEEETGDLLFVPELLDHLSDKLDEQLRVKLGQGIAGWVAQHDETVLSNDPYNDPRFFSSVDATTGFKTKSVLCAPLRLNNQVIGVLEVFNKRDGDFVEFDRQLIEAIVSPLAIALNNAQLHSEVIAEKRRIETIFESMSDGIVTLNRDGRIIDHNDAFLSLLQRNGELVHVERLVNIVTVADSVDFPQFVAAVIENRDDPSQITCDLQLPNGEVAPVLVGASTIYNEQGQIQETILVFSDLTQIHEVERMRDDFFTNIVHELRTPFATILMYARLLRSQIHMGDTDTNRRFLEVIEQESDRLQMHIRQMLAVARNKSQEIKRSDSEVDMNLLLDEVTVPLAQRAEEKGIQFVRQIPDNLPTVKGDTELLYVIFKNLVENAVKFTLDGEVTVAAEHDPTQICVKVSDTGIGVPQEGLPSLFKRFYRSSTAVEHGIAGTGLGLYMVKEGIAAHNGTINVDSEIGKGTAFTVFLPI